MNVVRLPGRVVIERSVVERMQALLRNGALRQHEMVLYLAGVENDAEWRVTSCLAPPARTTRGSYSVSAAANATVVEHLVRTRLSLLGQLHTHPGSWVGHSRGDDLGAFMAFPGYLSVVVPHHGRQGLLPWSMCGVHRYEVTGFQRLDDAAVTRLITVQA